MIAWCVALGVRGLPRVACVVICVGLVACVLAFADSGWLFADVDRFDYPKELVMHACVLAAAALCALAARRIALSLVDTLWLAFLGLSLVSMIAASPPNLWMAARAIALSVTTAAAFWTARFLVGHGYRRALLVTAVVAVVLAALTVLLDAYGVTKMSLVGRAPSGTFGVRNYAGHAVAIGLPTLVVLALATSSTRYLVAVAVGIAVCVAALVLTRSRASWLATACSFVTLAIVHLAFRRKLPSIPLPRILAVVASVLVGVAIAVVVPTRLAWKSDNPNLDTLAGIVDTSSGTGRGRLLQYRNTAAMIGDHPAVGVGPAQWHIYYPVYAPAGDPSFGKRDVWNTPARPTSDWIGITAERGVAAALVLVSIFGLLALASIRAVRDGEPSAAGTLATCVVIAVVGALDCPLQMALPNYLAFVILAAAPLTTRYAFDVGAVSRVIGCVFAAVLAGAAILFCGRQIQALRVVYDRAPAHVWEHAAELSLGHQRLELAAAQAWLLEDQTDRAIQHARYAVRLNCNYGPAQKLINLHPPTRGHR